METLGQWCQRINALDAASVLGGQHSEYQDYYSLLARLYKSERPEPPFLERVVEQVPAGRHWFRTKLKDLPIGKEFAKVEPTFQRDLIIAAAALASLHSRFRYAQNRMPRNGSATIDFQRAREVFGTIGRHSAAMELLLESGASIKQPWDEAHLLLLLTNYNNQDAVPFTRVFRFLETWAGKHTWTTNLAEALHPVVNRYSGADRSWRVRAEQFGEPKPSGSILKMHQPFYISPCDSWTSCLVDRLNTLDESQRLAWTELLAHCESATSSAPTKAFLKKAGEQAQAIGGNSFADIMVDVLESIGTAYHEDIAPFRAPDHPYDATLIEPSRADLLRGLIWTTSLVDDKALLTALAGAADRCFQKIRNVGPRAPKIGNACLWVFAHNESLEAVAQLNRLLGRVKHASVRKQIERSLNAAAEHHGLSRSDLEDMAVPTCGFTSVGKLRQQLGDYTAVLNVQSTSKTKLEWLAPSGKIQKSIPKVIKDEFASDLKALKAHDKLAQQTLAGQRDRLESFYLSNKKWTYPAWREHVADHPLMGWFAQRLIWTFATGETVAHGMWRDHALVDMNGATIDSPKADTLVSLWHPIVDTPEAIRAWRNWMMENEVTQPFKQAYRELYILTDAERNTGTYSNRFASHVIKQHQFRALCQSRGWQYDLMGQWDSHNTPEKILPAHNLRAEFWVEQAANETASEMGIFLYLATDQVRFYECDAEAYARDRWSIRRNADPIPLDQIPPLVLSEILRDVDLFVGVASVGNDPTWNDGGPEGRYRNYWQETSFGDLTATAQTRREILERLVPRLKIADRCSFDDKFLVVRGERRTYKIHLGSSNILMEPNDQYLCIVPGRGEGGGDKVFLPFEGDQRLAVILSKAMMLAEDTKITDRTILSQIERK